MSTGWPAGRLIPPLEVHRQRSRQKAPYTRGDVGDVDLAILSAWRQRRMAVVTFTIIDEDDRHFDARYTVQSADQGTADFALNNAVILQFLEQGFHGGLYHHDRWDGKYHAP